MAKRGREATTPRGIAEIIHDLDEGDEILFEANSWRRKNPLEVDNSSPPNKPDPKSMGGGLQSFAYASTNRGTRYAFEGRTKSSSGLNPGSNTARVKKDNESPLEYREVTWMKVVG